MHNENQITRQSYQDLDKSQYKVYDWRNPFVMHWIINPGLAFNELILGQRVPKISFLNKDKSISLAERTLIPCPHCDTLHSSSKWSHDFNTVFGNWFGLYCDQCHQVIPCLRNAFAWIIVVLTMPIWYFFRPALYQKWLSKQQEKFAKIAGSKPKREASWLLQGFVFGIILFILMGLVFPLLNGDEITMYSMGKTFVIYQLGGLLFGATMGLINKGKVI